ncbi:MAG: ATP-dependent zinc protease [Myxococcota bacterium]
MASSERPDAIIGWREWIALPELGIERIKAKVDTGARSSALHAIRIEEFERDGDDWVRFQVHPKQRDASETVACEYPVHDRRSVRSSVGHQQNRIVIRPKVEVMGRAFPIDLTLTNRDAMGFRMLLGREATRGRFLVDPGASFLAKDES